MYKLMISIGFIAAIAIASPGPAVAQVEVGPGGVTVGPHHDQGAHPGSHDAAPVHSSVPEDHTTGSAHGGPAVRIETSPGGHVDDHARDRPAERH